MAKEGRGRGDDRGDEESWGEGAAAVLSQSMCRRSAPTHMWWLGRGRGRLWFFPRPTCNQPLIRSGLRGGPALRVTIRIVIL